jgi:CDP-diacylglycerol---glycerol-3-phosphate 3-phosphatidyltransferase
MMLQNICNYPDNHASIIVRTDLDLWYYMSNVPNKLTFVRIALIPLFIMIFYFPFTTAHYIAAALFTVASLTDWLDGYLARKLSQESSLGAFLDPVADKLLVVSTLLLLVGQKELVYITIPALIIVARELVISSLREWMAAKGLASTVAVNYLGKIKTFLQMLALILLIAFDPGQSYLGDLGVVLLYLAAVMTVWSMVFYIIAAVREKKL